MNRFADAASASLLQCKFNSGTVSPSTRRGLNSASVPNPFPFGQFPVRGEGQTKILPRGRSPDSLSHTHTASAAIKAGPDTERNRGVVFEEPLSNGRAVAQCGRFVRRTHFGDGLVVAEIPDSTVPVYFRRRSTSCQEAGRTEGNQPTEGPGVFIYEAHKGFRPPSQYARGCRVFYPIEPGAYSFIPQREYTSGR